ncbi:DegT/DnrJ/EryC1/StrS family aminotransferase [Candidatus Omnitrophota bacterium]
MYVMPRNNVNLSIQTIFRMLFDFGLRPRTGVNYVQEFQRKFSDYIGSQFAVGFSSARVGLYILLKNLDLQPGDEIILSAYNFPPILMLVKLLGYKPVFVDIKKGTANIDVDKIEEALSFKSKVIFVSHMYGYPANMEKIMFLAQKHKLFVIEDCAHALGAKYQQHRLGALSNAAIFSFGYGKIMPCFGGGMVTLKDEKLYYKLKQAGDNEKDYLPLKPFLKTLFFYFFTHKNIFPWTIFPLIRIKPSLGDQAIREDNRHNLEDYAKIKLGLSKLQAKTGILQLDNLEKYLYKNKANATLFDLLFNSNRNIEVIKKEENSEPAYLHYRLKVNNIDRYRKELLKKGIDTKSDCNCTPHEFGALFGENKEFKYAEELKNSNIEIPNGPDLSEADVAYIAQKVNSVGD